MSDHDDDNFFISHEDKKTMEKHLDQTARVFDSMSEAVPADQRVRAVMETMTKVDDEAFAIKWHEDKPGLITVTLPASLLLEALQVASAFADERGQIEGRESVPDAFFMAQDDPERAEKAMTMASIFAASMGLMIAEAGKARMDARIAKEVADLESIPVLDEDPS